MAPGAQIRVMMVEDHALVRAAVRQAIDQPGLSMAGEASTAEEALLLAPRLRPDVLLVDIDLPGMDGIALVRELAPRLPDTRIVMLTVSRDDRNVLDAMRFGAAGYLTKDLLPTELVNAVRSVCQGEMAMDRQMAGRLVHRLLEASRSSADASIPADPLLRTLTPRECEVLKLLEEGLSDHDIAAALMVSARTVESHVSSILHKLGARNRAEAARRYREGQ